MAKKKSVSGKTHSRQQLNDYANQHNPNNKAYKANQANASAMRSNKKKLMLTMLLIWNGFAMAGVMTDR